MRFYHCRVCGANNAKVLYEGNFFCERCANLFGTCAMCANSQKCSFNDDSAPIPKIVTQRLRQETEMGVMEQIVQVPNPQRIKAFCLEEKCICCDHADRPHCMRQFGTCENYKEIEF